MPKKSDDTQNILVALSYVLFPIALILLVIEETKDKRTQDAGLRHHAYNALGFFVGAVIVSIPVMLIGFIPVLGAIIGMLFWIAMIVLAIVFAVRAYKGEPVIVPFVTDFLKKNIKGF